MISRQQILRLSVCILMFFTTSSFSPPSFQIALLKYSGGGDWYANPTSLPNLVKFANRNLSTNISEEIATVDVGSPELMNFPFIHMTGHGNVVFSDQEIQNLRNYLIAGGFLHIDDNYGLDQYIRKEIKKIFPGKTEGMYFFYRGKVLRHKGTNFDLSGEMPHEDFMRLVCKHLQISMEIVHE